MNLRQTPTIHSDDIKQLQQYNWPGNVRELQNVIERALILSNGDYLVFDRLSLSGTIKEVQQNTTENQIDTSLSLDEAMSRYIRAVLDKVYWKVARKGGAAEILNVKPSTLRFRMKKLGVTKKKR